MGTSEGLDERLAAFDRAHSYTTEKLIRESELERTELVRDAQGRKFIRKYISVEPGQVHPYEWVCNASSPYLQTVHETERIGDRLVVVCEYVEGTNLRDFVETFGALNSESARHYLSNVCEALRVLHGSRPAPIIHRDVHPGNIVITNGKAVLVDLGIARMRREGASRDTQLWGTQGYAAPEQFGFRQTDARADVYSLGMCLRYMVTGCEPGNDTARMAEPVAEVVYKATRIDPDDRYADAGEFATAARRALEPGAAAERVRAQAADAQQAVRDAQANDYRINVEPGAGTASQQPRQQPERGMWMRGNTKRSKAALVLFRIWQVYAVLYAVAFLAYPFMQPMHGQPLPCRVMTLLMCWFGGLVPALMSGNIANINDRIPWLARNRYPKMVLLWFGIWMALSVLGGVLYALGVPVFPDLSTPAQRS